jgi:hypothetical protein
LPSFFCHPSHLFVIIIIHQNDHNTVKMAVEQDWRALAHASDTLRNTFEIAMAAVRQVTGVTGALL